tara:strand:+ start:375 stop:1640 length:1266 start_codon:yes stop_codon:yes gene_type:complete
MTTQRGIEKASISLFSGAGIGDLGVEYGCGIPVKICAEHIPERADLIEKNFDDCKVITGDLSSTNREVVRVWKKKFPQKNPLLITISPPCQGMSTNGAGKIASQIRLRKRPEHDERNKLLLEGLIVVKNLEPEYILIENVPGMKNTVIMWKKKTPKKLIRMIEQILPNGYKFLSFVVDFADFGVPHHRKRLITVGKWMGSNFETTLDIQETPPPWIRKKFTNHASIKHTITDLCKTNVNDPLHREPRINEKHRKWIKAIPKYSGKSAHLNRCISCKHLDEFGIVICTKCEEVLPRPNVIENQIPRAIKGYLTSYRRMDPNKPANTLTMNSGVVSSDVTLHYSMDRVLTLKEILRLSTVINTKNRFQDTKFPWHGKYDFSSSMTDSDYKLQKNIIRQIIGECIPPLAMEKLVNAMINDWKIS